MPLRFLGSCSSVPPGYQFRLESLDLGPWPVTELRQRVGYCEADTAPLAFQGHWHNAEGVTSELSNVVAYPVLVTVVPEPALWIGIVIGALLLAAITARSRRNG